MISEEFLLTETEADVLSEGKLSHMVREQSLKTLYLSSRNRMHSSIGIMKARFQFFIPNPKIAVIVPEKRQILNKLKHEGKGILHVRSIKVQLTTMVTAECTSHVRIAGYLELTPACVQVCVCINARARVEFCTVSTVLASSKLHTFLQDVFAAPSSKDM